MLVTLFSMAEVPVLRAIAEVGRAQAGIAALVALAVLLGHLLGSAAQGVLVAAVEAATVADY